MNLRKLARGQECMLGLPGICNHNPETTVLAHIRNQWYSRGSKPPDICGVWACSSCHDVIDGRIKSHNFNQLELDGYKFDAICRQLHFYVKEGILKW